MLYNIMLSCVYILCIYIYIQYICTHVPNNKIKKQLRTCSSTRTWNEFFVTPHCLGSQNVEPHKPIVHHPCPHQKKNFEVSPLLRHTQISHYITLLVILCYSYTINISISHIPMISPCPRPAIDGFLFPKPWPHHRRSPSSQHPHSPSTS